MTFDALRTQTDHAKFLAEPGHDALRLAGQDDLAEGLRRRGRDMIRPPTTLGLT